MIFKVFINLFIKILFAIYEYIKIGIFMYIVLLRFPFYFPLF